MNLYYYFYRGHIVVVIEKDQKCKALPDLKHNRFSIA